MSLSKEILEGTYQGVERLLDSGSPVNIIDEYGYTPLTHAAVTNKLEIASLLLKKNANPNIADSSGSTALHWAIDNNDIKMVHLLLQYNANVNSYTSSGTPTLFYPLLRKNTAMIKLLLDNGANIDFARDFINAKLIGHRFELRGSSDVVTPEALFFSIDLEGFYLECTLDLIQESLTRFLNSYMAHRMDLHQNELNLIIKAIDNAVKLRNFKHFSKDVEAHQPEIFSLLTPDLLLLPVSFEGHAITFIRYNDFWAKCDRGVSKMTSPIAIDTVGEPRGLNNDFYFHLLYKPHRRKYIQHDLVQKLQLQTYAKLPIKHQVTGNCSWANVESSVPCMLYMLLQSKTENNPAKINALVRHIMHFYRTWLEWDKDRALEDWMRDFDTISFMRQKSKATLLGAVLFQACSPLVANDIKRAQKILHILSRKEFHYIIRVYISVFIQTHQTAEGQRFKTLVEKCGYQLSQFTH